LARALVDFEKLLENYKTVGAKRLRAYKDNVKQVTT
jgi:hypothetical protein